jgi:beta-galactosidase beta subunit
MMELPSPAHETADLCQCQVYSKGLNVKKNNFVFVVERDVYRFMMLSHNSCTDIECVSQIVRLYPCA